MKTQNNYTHFAIIGGGPAAMFMYKRLTGAGRQDFKIDIFERKNRLGAGMPYSMEGAGVEHVTNVSDNEIPELAAPIHEWIKQVPVDVLKQFDINPENFNEYKVLPRLLFGQYLSDQFSSLITEAKKKGIDTMVHFNCIVKDVVDEPEAGKVSVHSDRDDRKQFDCVIICTGHNWPKKYEGIIPDYFDSPYPPSKLDLRLNHAIGIKGSSLTAIDAIRTVARSNGKFSTDENGMVSFEPAEENKNFRIVMHSTNGFLPAVRVHLDDSHLSKDSVLSADKVIKNMAENNGFLSLDYVFEKNFKEPFIEKDPTFYERIKDMSIESFVEDMISLREQLDAFQLLKAEYAEAEKSIKRMQPVYWKEMLAVLSFAMNYPAKHFSAEDMHRLQNVLMPLISVVIAFVPQSSCKEILALYDAGLLELIPVGQKSNVVPVENGGAVYNYSNGNDEAESIYYKTFIDCVGQPHLSYEEFVFKSMVTNKTVSPALLQFKCKKEGQIFEEQQPDKIVRDNNGKYFLKVPGISINDNFQVVDEYGALNQRIYIMAVPYIGGYNPDYSGLDFCEEASSRIIEGILNH